MAKAKSKIITNAILFDSFDVIPNNQIGILENTTNAAGVKKLVAKVRLQTLEETNQNRRYYSRAIGDEIVEVLRPKALDRSLFQEIDHPSPSGDDAAMKRRAVTVSLRNSGSLIRDIYREGNEIIGEIETLSGFLGPDLYNTIVYDKADIGFSLRMFGKVEMNESTGMATVSKPIRPITYDSVTNPSHKTARIMQFLPENFNQFIGESSDNVNLLQESIINIDDLNITNHNEHIYDYLDRVVQEVFSQMGPIKFRF